jgi:EAL domain-containing protein (putative c-di-GMP-specific phosphodiesterase class I)/FixJ family two-component response regulator
MRYAVQSADELVLLVVEDHPFQRQALVQLLKLLGAKKVLEADNGRPALDIIRHQTEAENPIDLVICDIDMPDMDGLEFLRHIGQSHPKTTVAICSGKELPLLNAAHLMAREYGVHLLGVIQKPYTREAIGSLIERLHLTKVIPKPKPVSSTDAAFSIGEILHGLNSAQFEPYFQPKLSLHTGAIVGVEALARWHHPERGLIGPMLFIDPLEQHKKIDDLTFEMLSKSAQAAKRWQQQGIHLMVSVNLSLVSLTDFSLADKLTQLVFDAGIEPQNMILEITETMAMTEVAPALENLARLRLRGFGLSVDDYGTGFSSLRQLTRAPFTELKIDKSFVTDCANVKSLAAIVKSSIDMAHKLGIESVAEGVESQAVLDKLRVLECDIAQGYFIAQPMPERDLVKFLQP